MESVERKLSAEIGRVKKLLAKRIKQLRQERNLTQANLAEVMDTHSSAILTDAILTEPVGDQAKPSSIPAHHSLYEIRLNFPRTATLGMDDTINQDRFGNTALFSVVLRIIGNMGNIQALTGMAQFLRRYGASPDILNQGGKSALLLAQNNNKTELETLLKKEVSPTDHYSAILYARQLPKKYGLTH